MTFADLTALPWVVPTWLLRSIAIGWGCLWGSFANVVIHRLPRDLSVVRPGSHCPACGSPLRVLDNVPVLSWLFLGGRAHCCGARISVRYVIVELLGGLLGLAVFEVVVRSLPDDATLPHAAAIFLADFALSMALLAAAFIDAEHMYIPDVVTIGGTLFGLVTPGLRNMSWFDSFFGAGAGFLGVWLPFIVGYKALRGRVGMGLGDAKLVMLAGAWFGWRGVLFAIFAGAIQATLAALVILLVHGKIQEPESVRKDREELLRAADAGDDEAKQALEEDPLATAPSGGIMSARLPFGPFLCVAILEWMLGGAWLQDLWQVG